MDCAGWTRSFVHGSTVNCCVAFKTVTLKAVAFPSFFANWIPITGSFWRVDNCMTPYKSICRDCGWSQDLLSGATWSSNWYPRPMLLLMLLRFGNNLQACMHPQHLLQHNGEKWTHSAIRRKMNMIPACESQTKVLDIGWASKTKTIIRAQWSNNSCKLLSVSLLAFGTLLVLSG